MPKKSSNKKNPEVHEELKGFDININEFGEVSSSIQVDKINEFLNEKVEDKKLKEAQEQDENEEKQTEEKK
ncbi:MAG: hypothetical protein AAF849_04405 [Bacteroidota bacterium]